MATNYPNSVIMQALQNENFAKVVYTNNSTPGTSTIFSETSPPTINDSTLKENSNNIYINPSGQAYIWNGTSYVTYSPKETTEWLISGTTLDAQSNKTGNISRTGWVSIGKTATPGMTLDVERSGTGAYLPVARFLAPANKIQGYNTQLIYGVEQAAGNCSDWRFYYDGNGSLKNRIDFGFSGAVAPMISYLYNGYVGIGNTSPLSKLDVAGSIGAAIRTASPLAITTSGDHTILVSTASAVVTLESPSAVNRRIMYIKNISTGNITITGHIDGVSGTTITLLPNATRQVQSNGTSWYILSAYL